MKSHKGLSDVLKRNFLRIWSSRYHSLKFASDVAVFYGTFKPSFMVYNHQHFERQCDKNASWLTNLLRALQKKEARRLRDKRVRSSILIAKYVLRSKLQTFHKSSRPPSSTASIAEGGKTWWNFSSWPSQYLLRPSKVLTLAFKHYIGSSCCRRLVVNNLNFHQVNSLLRRDIFFWIWFPHIFRRRFALQRIITTRQDQIRLTRISLLIRHSKLRIYITRHPGIRILAIFRWNLHFSRSSVSCHPECPDPIRHVTTHYIKMMRQQKLIHSHSLGAYSRG